MTKNKTVRIACIESFRDEKPLYIYVNDMDEAKEILREFAVQNKFQSDLYPIPGLERVAAIEVLNKTDNEWDIVPM